jgi:hypothetical protein
VTFEIRIWADLSLFTQSTALVADLPPTTAAPPAIAHLVFWQTAPQSRQAKTTTLDGPTMLARIDATEALNRLVEGKERQRFNDHCSGLRGGRGSELEFGYYSDGALSALHQIRHSFGW